MNIQDFWRLVIESRLLTNEQCQQLGQEFASMPGAVANSNVQVLAEWLISKNSLTRYQVKILAAGRPGPFFYGDYKVYDRIEQGTLAGMFRAVHTATSHPVLLQFLAGPIVQSPQAWASAAGALVAQCNIQHPNLHRCYEPVDLSAFKFLVIEDLRGQSAEELTAGGKRLAPQQACQAARGAALGLAGLHQQNLAHGDVQPARLWQEKNGHVKLLRDPVYCPMPTNLAQPDAGLAKRADYLAPEFTQQGKTPDALTDIYGLGCTLYHLLAGRPPFPGGDVNQKMNQHATQPIQPLDQLGVPQQVAQIVTYMMAKNPSVRFQQAAQVAEQLAPFCDQNQLNIGPVNPPATAQVYEAAVRQKQNTLAAQAAAQQPQMQLAAGAAAFAAVTPTAARGPAIVTDTSGSSEGGTSTVANRLNRSSSGKDKTKKVAIGLGAAGAALIILLIVLNMGGDDEKGNGDPDKNDPVAKKGDTPDETDPKGKGTDPKDNKKDPAKETPADNGSRFVVEADNGQLPWQSPTEGQPISMRYVPPGSQFYLVARPSDILNSVEGQRVLQSMGPAFAAARSNLESITGVAMADMAQLIMTLHNYEAPDPSPAFTVHLNAASDKQTLLGKWGNPAVANHPTGGQYYKGSKYSYYIPTESSGKSFTIAPEAQIKDVLEFKGAAPNLLSEMEKLLAVSDDKRHFTLLFTPNELTSNLFRDGRRFWFGAPIKVRDPIDVFLGQGIKAGAFSTHFDPVCYIELMLAGERGRRDSSLAGTVRDQLATVPQKLEDYNALLSPHQYWKKISNRFPSMIRKLHRQSRIGFEGEVAVINAAMHQSAAHNLVFATEMTVAAQPGAGAVATGGPPKPAAPKTVEEVLQKKLSISFDQDSLEFSMQNIQNEVKEAYQDLPFDFRIKIIGDDLKLNGITRNQQIRDFSQQEKTVAEILTALVMKANPITTVKAPNEKDQKLVWVIQPDSDGTKIVMVTTRDASATKNYALPSVFQ